MALPTSTCSVFRGGFPHQNSQQVLVSFTAFVYKVISLLEEWN